ncbi:hypothetical protein [Luteolibacter marinus]|uniref:hypothetical protein n=1 Tax=Luteolibacter marinus TaxID=2776705 RepID=UPI001866C057|nr:hypothetical protein [Luteolibacter marinus]
MTKRAGFALIAVVALLAFFVLRGPAGRETATATATLRFESTAKLATPEIESKLSVIRENPELLDEIASRLLLGETWGHGPDETAGLIASQIRISVEARAKTAHLVTEASDPIQAALLANTAASVLRDFLETAKMTPEEYQARIRDQEDAVEDKRKLLDQIKKTEGIVYRGDPAPTGSRKPTHPIEAERPEGGGAYFANAEGDYEFAKQVLLAMKTGPVPEADFRVTHIQWAKVENK